MSREYEIAKTQSTEINVEIFVDWDEHRYNVIIGRSTNGGFFAIPNWGVSGELSLYKDGLLWNTDSIGRTLNNIDAGHQIAMAISEVLHGE